MATIQLKGYMKLCQRELKKPKLIIPLNVQFVTKEKLKKIEISKVTYDVPDGDKILIIKFECNLCNYSNNDIIPLTTNFAPGIMKLKVSNEDDLKSKIYRSPVGSLEIPELELVVNPGPRADFYYTNVEPGS
jgi:zinc finger protein